ncbi:MAG: efflux RND transporter permease subunit, partial [Flavobacteriales bacterium]|nr:efflux RND transporter permease subunit [Flavobacteriales bacterium]
VMLTLTSETYGNYALKKIADSMAEHILSLEMVGSTSIAGGRDRGINILIDPAKAHSYGVSLDEIRAALRSANLTSTLGSISEHNERYSVELSSSFRNIEELKNLAVSSRNGALVYLGAIAEIFDNQDEDPEISTRFAYGPAAEGFGKLGTVERPAVTVAVTKKTGVNAVTMATAVIKRATALKGVVIPDGVELIVTRDDGKRADDDINVLISNLGIALAAVMLITVIFLGFKQAFIVGMVIPAVLGLTLGAGYLCGFTLNKVSLFAVILVLGMIVDAAIVVIENISRHYRQYSLNLANRNISASKDSASSADKTQLTLDAVNEVGNPTSFATIAVIIGFSSMLLVSGVTGAYFEPISFNVIVAMFSSVLLAYTVVPWAAQKIMSLEPNTIESDKSDKFPIAVLVEKIISSLILEDKHRRRLSLSLVIGLVIALLLPAWQFIRPEGVAGPSSWFGVSLAFLPRGNNETFVVTLDMPSSTPKQLTDKVAREIGSLLREKAYLKNHLTTVGRASIVDKNTLMRGTYLRRGQNVADIRANIIHKSKRKKTSSEIVNEIRAALSLIKKRYPSSVIQVLEQPPGPPVRGTVMAEVYGRDREITEAIAKRIKNTFENTYDVTDVWTSLATDLALYRVVVDREKAMASGVDVSHVADILAHSFDDQYIGRMDMETENSSVPITLRLNNRGLTSESLSMVYATNSRGVKVPLSELTDISLVSADKPIHRKNYDRVTYVGGELGTTAPVYAVIHLNNLLDGSTTEDGLFLKTGNLGFKHTYPETSHYYHLLWEGEIRMTLDTFADFTGAFLLAVACIYIFLVAYYHSYITPLIAMSSIPMALIGVFPGHWITGEVFSATSMIGVIALSGIVVRNSLLIIDFATELHNSGLSLEEAIVQGTKLRVRAIMLTALSTICGTAIMIGDPYFNGLATSVIFGTIAATLLTLVVVPLLLYSALANKRLLLDQPA